MTCQCKVWGTIAVRTDKIIVEKAFLRRNFGEVQLKYVTSPNKSVTLRCRPPGGSPPLNITWFKNGEPLILGRGRRLRLTYKKDLVIRRLCSNDSGEYQCVAENMAARREGQVITLDVRDNISAVVCNETRWPCIDNSSVDNNGSDTSLTYENISAAVCNETQGPCNGQLLAGCKNGSTNSSLSCASDPPVLVFGSRDGLRTVDLRNTSKVKRIKAKNVVSLDFGSDPNVIYWSDKERINRFSLHNSVSEDMPFRLEDDNSLEGIAVDWVARKIYWTDAMHDAIYLGDLRNGRKVKLIEENLDFPRAIVLIHPDSYIYWTDWGQTPKIERARLDGTERTTFVSSGVQFPNGLAIDKSDKMLYWAGTDTKKYGIIEAISLDGLNRSVVLYGAGYHPFSLDVFEGFVYWSDWSKSAVLRMSKYGGGKVEVIVAGLNKPMGLKILHQRKIPPGKNPCDENNGDCEHLCLYLPYHGKQRCFCKEKFIVNENGKTCEKIKLQGESASKPSDTGTPEGTILLSIILLLAIIALVYLALKKRCSRPGNPPRMSREDAEEDQEIREESLVTDHTELMGAGSQLNNESSELSRQVGSAEPSGAYAADEDSSVRIQHNVVIYNNMTTKVEVEQHGGVTIVGDDAKVHHHYPPQN